MNKKMRELLQKIEAKRLESEDFLAKAREATDEDSKKDFMDKSKAALNAMKDIKEEFEIEKDLFEASKLDLGNETPVPAISDKNKHQMEVLAFAKAIAKEPLNDNEIIALSSLTGQEDGYLITKDIQTSIR